MQLQVNTEIRLSINYYLLKILHHQNFQVVQFIFTNIVYLPKPSNINFAFQLYLFCSKTNLAHFRFDSYFIGNDK